MVISVNASTLHVECSLSSVGVNQQQDEKQLINFAHHGNQPTLVLCESLQILLETIVFILFIYLFCMVDRWLQLPDSICLLPLQKNTSMPNYTNNVGKSALLRYHLSVNWCVCVCTFICFNHQLLHPFSQPCLSLFLGIRLYLNSSTGLNRHLSACQSIDGARCCCFHLCARTIWQTFLQGLCENDSAKMVAAHQRCYNFSCIKKHQVGKLLQGMVTADRS